MLLSSHTWGCILFPLLPFHPGARLWRMGAVRVLGQAHSPEGRRRGLPSPWSGSKTTLGHHLSGSKVVDLLNETGYNDYMRFKGHA